MFSDQTIDQSWHIWNASGRFENGHFPIQLHTNKVNGNSRSNERVEDVIRVMYSNGKNEEAKREKTWNPVWRSKNISF